MFNYCCKIKNKNKASNNSSYRKLKISYECDFSKPDTNVLLLLLYF